MNAQSFTLHLPSIPDVWSLFFSFYAELYQVEVETWHKFLKINEVFCVH